MRKYIAVAAFSGALSVALGAFGAHGLKEVLTPALLNSFLTGIRYQVIHSLLLLIVILLPIISETQKIRISKVIIAGIVLFSGSIYLLTLGIVPSKYVWFVTPLGGLLLLASWLMIVFYVLRKQQPSI